MMLQAPNRISPQSLDWEVFAACVADAVRNDIPSGDLLLVRTSLESVAALLAASRMTPAAEDEIQGRAGAIMPSKASTFLEWVDSGVGG